MPNPIEGRVILEVTRQHAILYLCDAKGIVVDNEVFRFPFKLERQDAYSEVKDAWDCVWDYLNHAVNWDVDDDPARGEQKPPKSK